VAAEDRIMKVRGWVAGAIGAAAFSFGAAYAASTQVSLQTLALDYKRPTDLPAPADNRPTAQRVALGKALFFDPRLSGSGAIACSTCHNPSFNWQDGQALGVGDHGGRLGRRTPTILNLAWSEPFFWDGRAPTLEAQAKGPMASTAEMNMPHDGVVAAVKRVPAYRAAFAAAYPGEALDIDAVAKAIAAYERTVVSGEAPFDRWVAGDARAMSPAAVRGFAVFTGKGNCASCHSSWRFTDDGFHDIGMPDADLGRAKIMPGLTILEHAFKTPTLRNIAERAPYMHDGSVATLEAVMDHYDHGFVRRASLSDQIKPLELTAQEKADVIAFLQALSSDDAPVAFPLLPR
jgi:cytochrome c peroxidase